MAPILTIHGSFVCLWTQEDHLQITMFPLCVLSLALISSFPFFVELKLVISINTHAVIKRKI